MEITLTDGRGLTTQQSISKHQIGLFDAYVEECGMISSLKASTKNIHSSLHDRGWTGTSFNSYIKETPDVAMLGGATEIRNAERWVICRASRIHVTPFGV